MKDPALFVNADCPEVQDVVNLAMNPRGVKGLAIVPQARLVDMQLRPYPLPVPISEQDPSALCTIDNGGYIRDVNTDQNVSDNVPGKATFKLYEFPGIRMFNTFNHMVRISTQYYLIEDAGPRLINEVPIGYFLFSIPDRTLLDSGNFWDIEAHSRVQQVADIGFENDYVLPAHFDVAEAARVMLMMDGLPPDEGGRQPLNAPSGTGGCSGCLPDDGTGTGAGYCQQGYAVTNPDAGTLPYLSSTVMRQRGATGFSLPVLYNTTIGMKIEPQSGAPVDPWICEPMPVQTITPSGGPAQPAFILSVKDQATNEMYLDTATGKVYDVITGAEIDPLTGSPGTVAVPQLFKAVLPESFGQGGGDGGVAVAQGNGSGYSVFGWAVNDTEHALTVPQAPGSDIYDHYVPELDMPLLYKFVAGHSGVKIDANSGHPIDPWNEQPMPYGGLPGETIPDWHWAGFLWRTSQLHSGSILYFNAGTLQFFTWDGIQSAGHLAEVFPQWNGVTPTAPDTVFQLAGGDGGVSTLPPGYVGPQIGSYGAYTWPDANNPGLTPSGCPTSGPDFPAYQILVNPSALMVLDPVTGRRTPLQATTGDNTIPFGPKDNLLAAVNQVLDMGIYWPLVDDAWGRLLIQSMPYVDGTIPQPDPYFSYRSAEDGVIYPGISQKLDATAIANKVVVRSENSKRPSITAVAYNRSSGSYISVQNLGRIIQKQPVIRLDTITDQSVLQLRAGVEVNLAALPAESLILTVMLNPFLDIHGVIGINVWSPDGKTLEITTTANPFLITAVKHNFAKRLTELTVGRLVPL